MIWDQAAINDLKRLHGEGIRPAEIARRMECSKNVIMGKSGRLGLAYPLQIIKSPGAEERPKAHKLHESTLPALASLSAPPPTRTIVLFQTVAAPILSIEDRDRRILLMADRTDGQCARLLRISPNVVRHVRTKQSWARDGARQRPDIGPGAVAALTPRVGGPDKGCGDGKSHAGPGESPGANLRITPPQPCAPALPPSLSTFLAQPVRPSMSCQWPTGERTSVYHTHRFCGCADVVPGKPYCAEHTKLAYVRVRYDGATL